MKKYLLFFMIFALSLSSAFSSGRRDKIFQSVEIDSASQIKKKIKSDPDLVYAKRDNKENLLMAALKKDREVDVIKVLLKNGLKSDSKDGEKKTVLMYASQYSTHPDVIKTIIEDDTILKSTRRRKVLVKDKNGKTAFDYAEENPNKNVIVSVLQKYAPVETKTPEPVSEDKSQPEEIPQTSELDRIAQASQPKKQEVEVQQEQEKQSTSKTNSVMDELPLGITEDDIIAIIEIPGTMPQTPAVPAPVTPPPAPEPVISPVSETVAKQEEIKTEETLPEIPALQEEPKEDVSSPTVDPYKTEYLFDYIEMADDEEIPENDPEFNTKYTYIQDADKRDLNGRTRLMLAAKNGDIKLMENLIYSGADINAKDNDGWTPLMFASRFQKNEKAVYTLLKKGANTKLKNNYGLTALILASGFSENTIVVNYLLNKRSITEDEVRSAFIYAITNDAPVSTIDLYVKKGIKLNIAYDGKTPLMYAAKTNKSTKIIEYLMSKGAKATYKSSEGKTAYQYAKENSRLPHDSIYWKLNAQTSGDNR